MISTTPHASSSLDDMDTQLLIDEFFEDVSTNMISQEPISASSMNDFDAMQVLLEDDHAHDILMSDHVFESFCVDGSASPNSPTITDDTSDTATDIASEVSTPPPSYDDDSTNVSPVSTPVNEYSCSPRDGSIKSQIKVAPPSPVPTSVTPILPPPIASLLPFAFPLACYPPLNLNQKRPLPDVLPNATVANVNPTKKTRREIRQMKNRESANRSRLRRKDQLNDLSAEVEKLTTKKHELENTVAALRAENQSLHDQNKFLRSLVTMYSDSKVRSTGSGTRSEAIPSIPRATGLEKEDESEVLPSTIKRVDVAPVPNQNKSLLRSSATVSALSMGLCASMFGLTIMTNVDGGLAHTGNIRRVGRVLHSFQPNEDITLVTPQSTMEWIYTCLFFGWCNLPWSELLSGFLFNIMSFAVIFAFYRVYTYVSDRLWNDTQVQRDNDRSTSPAKPFKRRSVSCQDARHDLSSPAVFIHLQRRDNYSPAVHVFT